jgi:hypothetical protein
MSGKHARRRPRWAYALTGGLTALATSGVLFLSPASAGAVTPSQDACHTTTTGAPSGDCGPFKQVYRETFNNQIVPVGAFSSCSDSTFQCAGLKSKYGRYYTTLGAYPDGWPDTATSGADGNGGRTFGGYYRPQLTISVRKSGTDGQLRVHMYRSTSGGSNKVAAVVPLRCANLRYGKFTERFIVRTRTNGYKMAHLHYSPDEIDYPEAGGNFAGDPVSVFTHGFDEYGKDVAPNSAWSSWHTYSQEITPGHVKIYFDGKLVASRNVDYPRATEWVLQNESALGGGYAAKGSSVDIDTTWITAYSYQP